MSTLIVTVLVLVLFGGAALVATGIRGKDPAAPSSNHRAPRRKLSRRTTIGLSVGVVGGVVLWLVSGWAISVIVVPVAVIGMPVLLSKPAGEDIARLDAMAEWVRSLVGVLTVGRGLEQAIIATRRSTPEPLTREVGELIARLRAGRSTEGAIRAFAEDLGDATGDLVCSALLLGSRMRDGGLIDVLTGLAETVSEDVRNRRTAEAERAKPRTAARVVSIVSVVLVAGLAFTGYLDPLKTPVGQIILVALVAAFVAVLVWMRRMTRAIPPPRFLGAEARAGLPVVTAS